MPKNGVENKKNDKKAQKRKAKEEEKSKKDFMKTKYKTFQMITTELNITCTDILKRSYPKGYANVDKLVNEIEKVIQELQTCIDRAKDNLIKERDRVPGNENKEEGVLCCTKRKTSQVADYNDDSSHPEQLSEAWPSKSNDTYFKRPAEDLLLRQMSPYNKTHEFKSKNRRFMDTTDLGPSTIDLKNNDKQPFEPEPDYSIPKHSLYSRHLGGALPRSEMHKEGSKQSVEAYEKVVVKNDKDQLTKYENMEMEFKEKIHKLQEEVKELKKGNDLLVQEKNTLQRKLESNKTRNTNLKQNYETWEREYPTEGARNKTIEVAGDTHQGAKYENMDMEYKENTKKFQQEVAKVKDNNDLLTQEKNQLQKKLEASESRSTELQQDHENLKREFKENCDELQQIRQVKEQEKHLWNKKQADLLTKIESLDGQVKKLMFEKNDALTRLSELAGRRLVENNPAIADLSTEIRPTKIGENFMQVYDNEWTDAFEELQEGGNNDDHCISILLKISQENFELATQFAKKFREKLFSTISCFPAEPLTDSMKQNNTPEKGTKDEEQLINQLKRVSAARTMKSIQEFVRRSSDMKEKKYGEKCERYAEKCLEMCWYMAIQSPPLALIFEVKRLDPFDDRFFKKFVTTGDKFDYVVWPCILLHEDGPILAKGVAQAIKADSTKRNSESETVISKRSSTYSNVSRKEKGELGDRTPENSNESVAEFTGQKAKSFYEGMKADQKSTKHTSKISVSGTKSVLS